MDSLQQQPSGSLSSWSTEGAQEMIVVAHVPDVSDDEMVFLTCCGRHSPDHSVLGNAVSFRRDLFLFRLNSSPWTMFEVRLFTRLLPEAERRLEAVSSTSLLGRNSTYNSVTALTDDRVQTVSTTGVPADVNNTTVNNLATPAYVNNITVNNLATSNIKTGGNITTSTTQQVNEKMFENRLPPPTKEQRVLNSGANKQTDSNIFNALSNTLNVKNHREPTTRLHSLEDQVSETVVQASSVCVSDMASNQSEVEVGRRVYRTETASRIVKLAKNWGVFFITWNDFSQSWMSTAEAGPGGMLFMGKYPPNHGINKPRLSFSTLSPIKKNETTVLKTAKEFPTASGCFWIYTASQAASDTKGYRIRLVDMNDVTKYDTIELSSVMSDDMDRSLVMCYELHTGSQHVITLSPTVSPVVTNTLLSPCTAGANSVRGHVVLNTS